MVIAYLFFSTVQNKHNCLQTIVKMRCILLRLHGRRYQPFYSCTPENTFFWFVPPLQLTIKNLPSNI